MKINVIGKAHLKGTSKRSGNEYDFIQVHYNGRARGVEGLAALTVNLDPRDYPFADIIVGEEYTVEFDNRGYVVEFLPVQKGGDWNPKDSKK